MKTSDANIKYLEDRTLHNNTQLGGGAIQKPWIIGIMIFGNTLHTENSAQVAAGMFVTEIVLELEEFLAT